MSEQAASGAKIPPAVRVLLVGGNPDHPVALHLTSTPHEARQYRQKVKTVRSGPIVRA
ncbi:MULTISPECIES: hypothetical protein [Mycobacterium]|nr:MULTISPECIES: hypothetical protein [Mycobacterium]